MIQRGIASIAQALTEPVTWVPAALLLAVLVRALLSAFLRRCRPGKRGEAAVARTLRRHCAEVANDVIVRDGRGGLTQIDHLALTADGLLVVETKDFGGLIFGQAYDRMWTQFIGTRKNKFENPLRQNYGHVKAVEAFVPGVPVSGLVVFMDRARFPKGVPNGVTTLSQLPSTLPFTSAPVTAEHRNAWDVVLSNFLTDRLSRDAQLVLARRRKRDGE